MSENPVRIAMILSDDREVQKRYSDPNPSFGTAPAALLGGLAETLNCEVHIVSCVQRPVSAPAKIADNIFFHALVVPKWGWLRGAYVGCLVAIRRKLEMLRPDVVHGQGTERYYALAAAFSGFPNAITIHGNMRRVAAVAQARPFSFAWWTARLEGFVLPRTGGVICATTHTRCQVERLARRTWLVPNAVDPGFFDVENRPCAQRILLCVASIYVLKNQIGLMRALDPLAAAENFKVVFLGSFSPSDPYYHEFKEMVKNRPWCEHAGFASREPLKSWLKRATALLLPSFEENCPMAILEAMAAGVPVVASEVGGIPDLIENGISGLLCDPSDSESIRRAVQTVLNQPEQARLIAERAKEQARSRFQPTVVAAQHLEIYREVTGFK